MKLLLTSGGITNQSMRDELFALAGKSASELSIAFIPTAANVETEDKTWLVKDFVAFESLQLKLFDIVDIAALSRDLWQSRLEAVDVLVFGGGHTSYLMQKIRQSGLADILPKLLESRVYVGISAGSMVTAPTLLPPGAQLFFYPDETGKHNEEKGLGFVDFCVRPHLNSPHFPKVINENLEQLAKEFPEPIYAIDDQTAISFVNGDIKIITEGEYKVYNQR